jgi:hypothetical protein
VCPQPPQLAESVPVFDSHPLTGLPSQSENPALHCKPQLPAEQVAMLFGPEGHVLAQEPQLAESVPVFDSHPLAGLPSQSANPAWHCKPQLPAEQVAMLFGPVGQAFPQPPQFSTSFDVSTQFPEQVVVPCEHTAVQISR